MPSFLGLLACCSTTGLLIPQRAKHNNKVQARARRCSCSMPVGSRKAQTGTERGGEEMPCQGKSAQPGGNRLQLLAPTCYFWIEKKNEVSSRLLDDGGTHTPHPGSGQCRPTAPSGGGKEGGLGGLCGDGVICLPVQSSTTLGHAIWKQTLLQAQTRNRCKARRLGTNLVLGGVLAPTVPVAALSGHPRARLMTPDDGRGGLADGLE